MHLAALGAWKRRHSGAAVAGAGEDHGLTEVGVALAAIVVGLFGGAAAYVFRLLIGVVHNLLFLGRLSFAYDANQHTPASPWGLAVVLVPMVGALAVVFLVENYAPEARGHGVPEVMEAIHEEGGRIRLVVAGVKALASAISIGSGGSVGREGPIAQIGAALASTLGRWLRASPSQLGTLVAAGGGAGIAATFNTPIGGVPFAVEVLIQELSARTLIPLALATGTATYVGRALLGDAPAFPAPELRTPVAAQMGYLPAYLALGVLTGLTSLVFIRGLYATEDVFERRFPGSAYLRHVAGMLLVGLSITILFRRTGHYWVEGVGYATVLDVLNGALASIPFLLALCGLKLAATWITLGSGASGGIFSPSMFLGATLGGAFGHVLHALSPGLTIAPAAFALAGMAGVVAGATGAAITALVMIFEMTRDYSVVLPMTLTVALSYAVRRALCRDSIYTLKLSRRGIHIPDALYAGVQLNRAVGSLALLPVRVRTSRAGEQRGEEPGMAWVKVDDHGRPVQVHRPDGVGALLGPGEFEVVPTDMRLGDLVERLSHSGASAAVVVEQGAGGVVGVLDAAAVLREVARDVRRLES
ncbi:MAG: chloride channel protein [Deltaproteobacteria bacterium]|nr:chloride channel protein [Deltaproteobacteria bacterium]